MTELARRAWRSKTFRVAAGAAGPERVALAAADLTVGVALVGLGLVAWELRPETLRAQ